MPGKGVLFALEATDERHMLALTDEQARAAFVANSVEERWDTAWLHAMEGLWHPVHFCLHGSSGMPLDGASAESKAIFGGVSFGIPNRYRIDYKDAELVRRIASALSRMRDDALWARAGLVERKDYQGPRQGDIKVAVVDEIHALVEFYRRANEARRAVIFTVDA